MATTPAAMEIGKRRTHADTFREFLRKAPEYISKDDILGLIGSGKGFANKRDIENRITQARAAGDISPQGKDRRMKNYRFSGATSGSVKHINGGGVAHGDLSVLDRFVNDARDLAEDAMIDTSITRDQLLEGLLMLTAAFSAVKKSQAS